MERIIIFVIGLIFTTSSFSSVFNESEVNLLKQNFLANFRDKGAIVASPSKAEPNYYYDWVRDSGIAMNLVAGWYEHDHDLENQERMKQYTSWVELVQRQQSSWPNQDILGEPKFYLNGQPYEGAWGRPQNDGPALRALALIRFANTLSKLGDYQYITDHLYSQSMDPDQMGVIKKDLEYVAHHWQDKSFDLWEEVYGHHFFTSMVQRKALVYGAKLARMMNDHGAADYYESQVIKINERLKRHIDYSHQVIQATMTPHAGPIKDLELDMAVILGVLLGDTDNNDFTVDNEYVHNTAQSLKEMFNANFPINDRHRNAILFGRYPGDTYDGYRTDSKGNPWFILTATMAEYYYTLAVHNSKLAHKYISLGDAYLQLVKDYAPDLKMKEQINLQTGKQQGADSLTWSYVSVLRAIESRAKLKY